MLEYYAEENDCHVKESDPEHCGELEHHVESTDNEMHLIGHSTCGGVVGQPGYTETVTYSQCAGEGEVVVVESHSGHHRHAMKEKLHGMKTRVDHFFHRGHHGDEHHGDEHHDDEHHGDKHHGDHHHHSHDHHDRDRDHDSDGGEDEHHSFFHNMKGKVDHFFHRDHGHGDHHEEHHHDGEGDHHDHEHSRERP